jgi:hypothetical protein
MGVVICILGGVFPLLLALAHNRGDGKKRR